jgi:branched-chain amino acid transport system permease protein/neutral amino acid transport system permease protein
MQSLALYIGFGLVTASILCIGAVGFTLQFGISNLFNLAFGATMTAAAFVAYVCNAAGLNIWVSLALGSLAASLLSFLLNRGIYNPFKRRATSRFTMIMVTLGVGIIIQYGIEGIWGADNRSYNVLAGRSVHVAGMLFTTTQLTVIAIAAVAAAAVHVVLRYTRLGKAMRATAANRNLARNCGIRTDRVVTLTWLITGALCGLAGAAFAINSGTFGATSTDVFLVLILAAVFLGGPGEPYGAMLGALVIGLATEMSAAIVVSSYKDVIAFLILLAMLGVRPNGLLGAPA